MELRVAKQKVIEHSASNFEDDAAGVTAAMEKVRAEVTATAEQQDRVMDKLRWIKHVLHQADPDITQDEASVPPRTYAAAGDTDAQAVHSLEPPTIDLANNHAHSETPDGPTCNPEDMEFSPRTEQAIVESLQSSIGVTTPQ